MHHVHDRHVRALRSAFLAEVFDEADEDPTRACRCSSVALLILGIARDTRVNLVSQAITTVFHAPAAVYVQPLRLDGSRLILLSRGARLRIVNKTTSFGSRTVSARVEVRFPSTYMRFSWALTMFHFHCRYGIQRTGGSSPRGYITRWHLRGRSCRKYAFHTPCNPRSFISSMM